MSEQRRDSKGRKLRNGEMQMKDGRYRYKYVDFLGEAHVVYSWKLERHDSIPDGKKNSPSLRELERQIQADMFDRVAVNGGNVTVLELVEKYISTKIAVRRTTVGGYKTVINFLKKDPLGNKRIDQIHISDAKVWMIKLQREQGRSYSSIHTIRGVLRPAFQMAVDDDLIRKNPFGFQLAEVLVNDSIRRKALTKDEERRFLNFVKEDKTYAKYYDGIYILLKTGLRISEFCGLTLADVDFKEHKLNVDHQLQKKGKTGYYIEKTKTECGTRVIPMTPDVEECFRRIVANRKAPKAEPMVEGYTGFLCFDVRGSIMYSLHWEHYFKGIVEKYNKIYRLQLPRITPHVCRHTYCTNMAKAGMNPKTLQYLMGHSDIGVTMNTYTHMDFETAQKEVLRLKVI